MLVSLTNGNGNLKGWLNQNEQHFTFVHLMRKNPRFQNGETFFKDFGLSHFLVFPLNIGSSVTRDAEKETSR
jgi:hypothetical protein